MRTQVIWALPLAVAIAAASPSTSQPQEVRRIAVFGLHGGVFETLRDVGREQNILVEELDRPLHGGQAIDLTSVDLVLIQHVQRDDADKLKHAIEAAAKLDPSPLVLSVSGLAEDALPELTSRGVVRGDERLTAYYRAGGEENMRRMLSHLAVTYLGHPGDALPPIPPPESAIYHPVHKGPFESLDAYLTFETERLPALKGRPRVLVAVHHLHRLMQQPRVVASIVEALETRGLIPVVVEDNAQGYQDLASSIRPDAVIHTCHSFEDVRFRIDLGVVHAHSVFFRRQSIEEWRMDPTGLDPSTTAFEVTSQELLGAIEPQVGAGSLHGGNDPEDLQPIPERIEHLVDRVASWVRLRTLPNDQKRIAVVYYNREMGKADVMRGSATGMFLNAPRSMMAVLRRMQEDGYSVENAPRDEGELLERMVDHGHQIGAWDPDELDRLARTGKAMLLPVERYRSWYEEHLNPNLRAEVEDRWGPLPGRIQVWTREDGREFFVIPQVSLGDRVVLLPQPLRGEAHDVSLAHDRLVPPSHNYLATYFWLQNGFQADAVVHFGTHGTEFLLPGKSRGPSSEDWGDIILGSMPNIVPWVINNLGESMPAKRRTYAVLVDHMVPPSTATGLSDDLLRLQDDLEKWKGLEEGAVRDRFLQAVSREVLKTGVDSDLEIQPGPDGLFRPEDLGRVHDYLHEIEQETTPTSLHTFGSAPDPEQIQPYIVTCLGKGFRRELAALVPSLQPDADDLELQLLAQRTVDATLRLKLDPLQAVESVGGVVGANGLPRRVEEGLHLARTLEEGLHGAQAELDGLLSALSGRFIPPGPGGAPDRNPGSLPTGRNMTVMNPEQIPTRPSWEVGKRLVDEFLTEQHERLGRYPKKVAFTLNSFATFQDYGVMEAQILYMIGVRPLWDSRNRVEDFEVIPQEELGRPRIDVFIAALSYYRDMLPTRMRLIDRAVRSVAELAEDGNELHTGTLRVRAALEREGVESDRAHELGLARIFGYPPGQMGSAGYYYLVERSGTWDTSEELMSAYLSQVCFAYTGDLWGSEARSAYEHQIQGSEVVLRSWSDRTRSPLSNKYDWYIGGSLSRAITHLTGEQPDYLFSDVRDPDDARIVRSEDALRREFRVRILNRKWLEGMMKEGYAGADQVAKHVSNAYGWSIMRDGAVSDDLWGDIVDTVIEDNLGLGLKEWFDRENPYAYQDAIEVLLEAARKGYFHADEETLEHLAYVYSDSVARHGSGGGMLSGGSEKLDRYIAQHLGPSSGAPQGITAAQEAPGPKDVTLAAREDLSEAAAPDHSGKKTRRVQGRALIPAQRPDSIDESLRRILAIGTALVLLGFAIRRPRGGLG